MSRFLYSLALLAVWNTAAFADQYAFIVGVEDYNPDQFGPLDYATEDAEALRDALKDLKFEVYCMTNSNRIPKQKPTSPERINAYYDAFLQLPQEDDVVVVAFTGHGCQFKDDATQKNGGKETWFCPEDSDITDKSTLVPMSSIIERLAGCTAERKLLLVDACRNELDAKKAGGKGATQLNLEPVFSFQKQLPTGMSVLFSCSDSQRSWEHEDLEHSVFTHFTLEYLTGTAPDSFYENGQAEVDGLAFYVRKKTHNFVLSRVDNSGQLPDRRGDLTSWPIGKIEQPKNTVSPSGGPVWLNNELVQHCSYAKGVAIPDGMTVSEFVRKLETLVAAENPNAMNALGALYCVGDHLPRNFEKAFRLFRDAVDANDAMGNYNLGIMYDSGWGVREDDIKALELYRNGARLGSAYATSELAGCFFYGKAGLDKDREAARKVIAGFPDQAHPHIMTRMSWLHAVDKNYDTAFPIAQEAAETSHPYALFRLGRYYYYGEGVSKDEYRGIRLMEESMSKGCILATARLSIIYRRNEAVRNLSKSAELARRAAERGNPTAHFNLAYMYSNGLGLPQSYQEAIRHYSVAAQKGNASSMYNLYVLYINGNGVPKNWNEARKWLIASANEKHGLAQWKMGKRVETGDGFSQDLALAIRWYAAASKNGSKEAEEELRRLGYR